VVIVSSFSDQFADASFERDQAIGDRLAVQDLGHLVGLVGVQHNRLRGHIGIAVAIGEQAPGAVCVDQQTEPLAVTGDDVMPLPGTVVRSMRIDAPTGR
jgi:hypothetical protein